MPDKELATGTVLLGTVIEDDDGRQLLLEEKINGELFARIDAARMQLQTCCTLHSNWGFELVTDPAVPDEQAAAMREVAYLLLRKDEEGLVVCNFAGKTEEIQEWNDVIKHIDLDKKPQAERPTDIGLAAAETNTVDGDDLEGLTFQEKLKRQREEPSGDTSSAARAALHKRFKRL